MFSSKLLPKNKPIVMAFRVKPLKIEVTRAQGSAPYLLVRESVLSAPPIGPITTSVLLITSEFILKKLRLSDGESEDSGIRDPTADVALSNTNGWGKSLIWCLFTNRRCCVRLITYVRPSWLKLSADYWLTTWRCHWQLSFREVLLIAVFISI